MTTPTQAPDVAGLIGQLRDQAKVLDATAFRLHLYPGDNNLQDAATYMREAAEALARLSQEIETLRRELKSARSGLDAEGKAHWQARDALAAAQEQIAAMDHALEFVARMAWRTDPPNAHAKLSDAERLSAIKFHPTIKSLAKPHIELAEAEAALAAPSAGGEAVAVGLLTDEEAKAAGVGRFGHHPDPAIDFEVEVESLQSRLIDAKMGINKPGHVVEAVGSVLEDIERALKFRVGGDPSAVQAKQVLRDLEAEARAFTAPQAPAPETEITESCGCVFCDVGLEPDTEIDGRPAHSHPTRGEGRSLCGLAAPAPDMEKAVEAGDRIQGMVRSIDQWRNMKPEAVAAGSEAQIIYALTDAKTDIAALWHHLGGR